MIDNRTENNPILFDGAFGTYYASLTGDTGRCESAVLTAPGVVGRIHKEYLSAGANAILTNTFAADPFNFPDPAQLREILSAAWRIANEAVSEVSGEEGGSSGAADTRTPAAVFADIGVSFPGEGVSAEELSRAYLTRAEIFLELGAKHFLFETLDDLTPVLPALRMLREKGVFTAAAFAVSPDGYTSSGRHCRSLISEALKYADIAGLNCVCGPAHMLSLMTDLVSSGMPAARLLAMPNSGYPVRQGGRLIYSDNPEYFAGKLGDIRRLGVMALGGCCGTTPEHIRLSAIALGGISGVAQSGRETAAVAEVKHSRLSHLLAAGDKTVIAVELDPPHEPDAAFLLSAAREISKAGADVITLADSPLARPRADSFMLAAKLHRELGVDVLPHLACRDRNRVAVKSALLGASIEGVANLLAVTGDPLPMGSTADDGTSGVFNFNSFRLMSYIGSLNESVFASKPFCICGALNVNAVNFDSELKRALKKIECGASALFTQALFTDESVENLERASRLLNCRIMAGVLPLAGYKNAVFLNNEVAGITIPDEVIAGLKDKSPEETFELVLKYSSSLIDRAAPYCDGFYIMMPLKKVEIVARLVRYIREKHPKPLRNH